MSPDASTQFDAWRDIESLLEKLAELAQTVVSPQEFSAELLSSTARSTAAAGGAVWLRDGEGCWRAASQTDNSIGCQMAALTASQLDWLDSDQLGTRLPLAATVLGSPVDDDTSIVFAQPIRIDDGVEGAIGIVRSGDLSPSAEQNIQNILRAFAEVAADYMHHQQRRQLRAMHSAWSELERFTEQAHETWELDAVCFTVANEARRLLECDRVTVLASGSSRGRFRAKAVSGVDQLDPRANEIRALERLAKRVDRTGEPLWHGTDEEFPPQIQEAIDDYVDDAHARTLALLPIPLESGERRVSGAIMLAIESLSLPADATVLRRKADLVVRHAAPALRNALRYRQQPLWRLTRVLERVTWLFGGRRLPRTLIVATALGAILAASALVTDDLEIRARGRLLPAKRQHLFAPADAVVDEIKADHGDLVDQDDLLLRLREPRLDYDYTRTLGEMQTAAKDLHVVQTTRLNSAKSRKLSREELNELTAREERLKGRVANLNQQLEILQRRRDDFEIRSPLMGQVVSWDLRGDLKTRPVQRGMKLMTIADTGGDWLVELDVPDERMKHVIAARKRTGELRVRFILASDPNRRCEGTIRQIAMAVDSVDDAEPTVRVIVEFDREQLPDLHYGASVIGQIDCGRRSVGYVWLHGVYERIRMQFF
ncbi:MAG: HlyD family secretion protein [Pirellulaceae bacterium]|jgi:hypothetical protein|nr:HlyD family secretion protein [Pirellulaceae bacterium]MDP7017696.1 HlyD family secretion protein [Pirellulaceae bacterium]